MDRTIRENKLTSSEFDRYREEFQKPFENEQDAHNSEIPENYRRLVDSASPVRERVSYSEPDRTSEREAPVRTERPAFVRADPTASNVARIADYVAPPAPAETSKRLFEDVKYTKGFYTMGPREEETPVYSAPVNRVYAAPQETYAPAPVYAEEDSIPTARTMLHRTVEEGAAKAEPGFWASLSVKTRLLLATVVATIVVAIAIVCINTAVLNSIHADIAEKKAELGRLTESVRQLDEDIARATSPERVEKWAKENGMIKA